MVFARKMPKLGIKVIDNQTGEEHDTKWGDVEIFLGYYRSIKWWQLIYNCRSHM